MEDSLPSPSHIGVAHPELSAEDFHDLFEGGILGDDVHHHHHEEDTADHHHGDDGIHPQVKALARTERKRSREKQRRSDVNKQFAELTSLLRRIEAEDPDETRHLPAYSPSNRVDLMSRTVQLLTSLFENNKKRKLKVMDLEKQLEEARKAGEETAQKLKESMMAPQSMGNNKVMMMVPMMIGGDNTPMMMQPWPMQMPCPSPAPSADSGPIAAQQQPAMMMPFGMMPQMMPMPMAAPQAAASPAPASPSAAKKTDPNEAVVGSNLAHCA